MKQQPEIIHSQQASHAMGVEASESAAPPAQGVTKELSPRQEAEVDNWKKRCRELASPGFIEGDSDNPRSIKPNLEHTPEDLWYASFAAATGCDDMNAASLLASQIAPCFCDVAPAKATTQALALTRGIAPRDALEGMLAMQMVATHNVAMEMLRRMLISEQPADIVNRLSNQASKLLRVFCEQVDTLNTYRGKTTEQKMTVEHVNVHEGGQAIVGNVSPGKGRTGDPRS